MEWSIEKMESLFFAFGSMLVLMLAIYFLPIGITKKGKFVIIIVSFLLAILGIISTTSFVFWQTISLLIVLIFFISLYLYTRFNSFLFLTDNKVIWKRRNSTFKEHELNNDNLDREVFFDSFKITRNEMAASKHVEEFENTIIPLVYEQSEIESNEPQPMEDLTEFIEDDISFLLKRSVESMEEKNIEVVEDEIGYLSEIESLLNHSGE